MESGFLRITAKFVIIALMCLIVGLKAYLFLSERSAQGRVSNTLATVREAIKYHKAKAVYRCGANPNDPIEPEQLNQNDMSAAGECKEIELSAEERRFVKTAHIPENPYNHEKYVVKCEDCLSPCDPKCLSWAALQSAGWCLDPQKDAFWAASNKDSECAL